MSIATIPATPSPVIADALHPYFPTWSPKFDLQSRRVLNFKNGDAVASAFYADELDPRIPSDAVLAVVPSHDPQKRTGPLHRLVATLVGRAPGRVDGSACLVRHTYVDKLSHGGSRLPEVHLRSVRVDHQSIVQGRAVVLIDDVTTSGGSFEACRQLLLEAGAVSVRCMALARTTH